MAKYKTKSEYVEVFQYDGDLKGTDGKYYVPDWAVEAFEDGTLYYEAGDLYLTNYDEVDDILIKVGDYIVCHNDSFGTLSVFDEESFRNKFEQVG